jgi:hypothetical protein
MINLTEDLQPVADLFDTDGIASGSIYIAVDEHGAPGLPASQRVVLWTGQGETLELTTRNQVRGRLSAPGTYLNTADYNSLNFREDPKVRLYTWGDTFAKIRSGPGMVLLLPAILALFTAVAGLFFILSGQPSTAAVVDQAQAVAAWAAQHGPASAAPAMTCLQLIAGHDLPAVTIPGVTCVPPPSQWWRSTVTDSLITGGIAILAAVIGMVALPAHYGFRKNPAAGS